MTTITRQQFDQSFVPATVDELVARAGARGVTLSPAQRAALTAADLNGDGLVGAGAEQDALWTQINALDHDRSARTVTSGHGEGYALAAGIQVPAGRAIRQQAVRNHGGADREHARGQRLEARGNFADASAAYERAADLSRETYIGIDTPASRRNEIVSLRAAARAAHATGDHERARHFEARADAAKAELHARFPRYPYAP